MRWLYLLLPTAYACLPPLRSNYNFHDVPGGSGFELVEDIQSVENYFYETQKTLEAMALTANADMAAGFDTIGPALSAASGRDLTYVIAAAKQTWVYCQTQTDLPVDTCTKAAVRTGMCTLPTLSCGDNVTASYDDKEHYYVAVDGNTWSIRYKEDKDAANDPSDHILATEKVGVAATFITPVTQLCYALTHELTNPICPQMQTIQLMEPIMPNSTSNLEVADTFVLDIDDSKDYFHSHYAALKQRTVDENLGELPAAFGSLGLTPDQLLAAQMIYAQCGTDISCEKSVIHAASCLGDTVDCNDGEKWFYNDGDHYSVDTTEDAWTVRYGDKVLATAPIGEGATTITPITQVDANNPVSVSLATPFEPLYLGAYDLGTTVTCEFGTPVSTCTSDVLSLSGCYATFAEECDDTPIATNYIDKQCCQCS